MMPRTLLAICAALLLAIGVVSYADATSTANDTYGLRDSSPAIGAQQGDDSNASDGSRVHVQVWTVMAAGGAAAIGLVLYVVRVVLGRVPPPPPREETHH